MNISPELIAIGILGVSLVSLGWRVTGDLRQEIHQVTVDLRQEINQVTVDLRQEINLVRKDVSVLGDRIGNLEHCVGNLDHRVGNLEHRVGNLEHGMARLEGWIEGRFVKQPELKAKPATSS